MEEKVLDILAQLHNEIKDIKVNMATKEDLAGMVTKDDLDAMVEKYNLSSVATKEDLEVMAKKYNLSNVATKDDIRKLEGALFRLENKLDNKFDVLFDGYKQNTEAIYELRTEVQQLKSTVERHEVKLKIVK